MKTKLSHDDILRVLAESGLAKVAARGNCFTAAAAIRRALLPAGVLVVAASKAILKKDQRFVGHAAVRHAGHFYHGEGWMDWEEFLDWARRDPQDRDFADLAGLPLRSWSRVAGQAEIYEVDEEELMSGYVKPELLPEFEKALLDARSRLGL